MPTSTPRIALSSRFTNNAGQGCSIPTRLLVERPVYERVLDGVAQRAQAVVAGDPFDPGVTMGPVISNGAAHRILDIIAALATDTQYGLAAYAETRSMKRARRLIRELAAGNVHINGSGPGPAVTGVAVRWNQTERLRLTGQPPRSVRVPRRQERLLQHLTSTSSTAELERGGVRGVVDHRVTSGKARASGRRGRGSRSSSAQR